MRVGFYVLLTATLLGAASPVFAETATSTEVAVYDFPVSVWGGPNGAFSNGTNLTPYSPFGRTLNDNAGLWEDISGDFTRWHDPAISYTFSSLETYLVVSGITDLPEHPLSQGSVQMKIYLADNAWSKGALYASSELTPANQLVEVSDGTYCSGDGTTASPFSDSCIVGFAFTNPVTLEAGQYYIFEISTVGVVSPTFYSAPSGGYFYYPGLGMVGASVYVAPYGNDGVQDSPNNNTGAVYMRLLGEAPTGPSNVLFLPGIKGSRLVSNGDVLWPADFTDNDIPQLALTEDGVSVYPVVVDGILENYLLASIYADFVTFMNGLVAEGTIETWYPFAYDWRFAPEQIIEEGVKTPGGTVDIVAKVEELAASSKSGKVTIVAHSNGGLLGKALIKKLQTQGKENLIDNFVMVGSPQLGTPSAVSSLLHGYDENLFGGFLVDASDVREVALNFPSIYNLLPSRQYFDEVSGDPVVSFGQTDPFTESWRAYWGETINSYTEFFEFLTGTGVSRVNPSSTDLLTPAVLQANLLNEADVFHNTYDSFEFPDSIRVVQIAGWGLPTVKRVNYRRFDTVPSYSIEFTEEGDGVVVYPSANADPDEEIFYFENSDFNAFSGESPVEHRDLLSAEPIQRVISNILNRDEIQENGYILSTKPEGTAKMLLISAHSPVILGAYDAQGRFTGISSEVPSEGFLPIHEEIPGSSFTAFGGGQYLFLPQGEEYNFVLKGTNSGLVTVVLQNFENDTASPVATYSDVPITGDSVLTFETSTLENVTLALDGNGDGEADTVIHADGSKRTPSEVLQDLKEEIQVMSAKKTVKFLLYTNVTLIEKAINDSRISRKKVLALISIFEEQVKYYLKKNQLSTVDGAKLLALTTELRGLLMK